MHYKIRNAATDAANIVHDSMRGIQKLIKTIQRANITYEIYFPAFNVINTK